MRREVGVFYRDNFLNRVYAEGEKVLSDDFRVAINCFAPYIRSILKQDGDLRLFQTPGRFKSLKSIEFYGGHLTSIGSIEKILPNLETLKFIHCKLDGDLHDKFLQYCSNLKRLYVRDSDAEGRQRRVFIGNSNSWLNRKYTKLEHFEVNSRCRNEKVILFLKQNRNIVQFSTTIEFLMENFKSLSTSKIQLNTLAILHLKLTTNERKFINFVDQMLSLQKRGIFKHLHLYFRGNVNVPETIVPKNVLLSIKLMHITNEKQKLKLSYLINLEKLYLLNKWQIADLDAALNTLTRLNYIYFERETIDNILPFIKNLPNLRKIAIDLILNGHHFDDRDNIINVSKINDERRQLTNATKLTFCVREQTYLATKKSLNGAEFEYFEVKRIESDNDVHDFTNSYGVIG